MANAWSVSNLRFAPFASLSRNDSKIVIPLSLRFGMLVIPTKLSICHTERPQGVECIYFEIRSTSAYAYARNDRGGIRSIPLTLFVPVGMTERAQPSIPSRKEVEEY